MSLIDETYFIGELNLPGLNDDDTVERLQLFIDKYEAKFLKELLGYELYKAFLTGVDTRPVDDKWAALKSGSDYVRNGRTYRWEGLVQSDTSMIANYVYYYWMRNEVSQTTGIGEVITKSENSTRISPSAKMTRAWNEMVNQVWGAVSFLDTNVSNYPDWSWYGETQTEYWPNYRHARLRDIFYPINSLNL
jgi:hypothetical protein